MKIHPATLDEYLRETEHAVRHLYAGLDSCWAYYREALQYWDVSKAGQPMTDAARADLQRYLGLAEKYFDLKFSEATFAGSILQTAAMAIRCFSRITTIPASCVELVPPSAKKAAPFCIGPKVHGVPSGLLVYAARNQYNHWDEKAHDVTSRVFDALAEAFSTNDLYDLAFELDNPTITVYANEVLLGALGWTSYSRYESELRRILGTQGDA